MNINLFESKQYILQTACAFSTISENERPNARRRLNNDEQGNQRAETTKNDAGHFAQITSKVLEILKIYPHLNNPDQMGNQLKEIRDRIVKISPTCITDEFKLFSKLIDIPVITVSASDYAFTVNSALLIFRSEKIKRTWRFEGIDDPSRLQLTDFTSEEILRAVHCLETGETQELTLENSWRLLHLADYLVIPKLLEAAQTILLKHFSSLKAMTPEDMEQIVTLLNQELINNYPELKSTLENCISQFFNQSFQFRLSRDYLAIKRQIKKLTQPIKLKLNCPNDLQLAQIKKLPLSEITFKNCKNLTYECWQILIEIKELRSVHFCKAPWVNDYFFEKVSQIQSIKELGFSDCPQITNEGVAQLSDDLHELVLSNCSGITDESSEKFKKMTQLRRLSLENTFIGDLTIEALNNEMEWLEVSKNLKITDRSAAKFKLMTRLQHLSIYDTSIGDTTVTALSNEIKGLELQRCRGVTDQSAEKFKKMTQLKRLAVDGTSIGDLTIEALNNEMEWLTASRCHQITDRSAEKLKQMTRLQQLSLFYTSIGDTTVHVLSNEIKVLSLNGCRGLTDQSAEKFKKMTNLTMLYLDYTSIGDTTLASINNKIHTLSIKSCPNVTDRSAEKFKQMTLLRNISLDSTHVGEETIKALNSNLELLGLRSCQNISDSSLPYIGNMKRLKNLRIIGTQISSQAYENLRQQLPGTVIE
jgi:hypothetical protein